MTEHEKRMDPDAYMDAGEFLPSVMETLVKEALQEREGRIPKECPEKELKMKWKLLSYRKKTSDLKRYRTVLAAACFLLTVGLAAAVFRPVSVEGNNTYITFMTADGAEEKFVFQYKEVEEPGGRSHKYKSFRELEAALGFSLVKPEAQKLDGLYLGNRPKSGFYNITVYFDPETSPVIVGYQAYFVRAEEEAYQYVHKISEDWEKTEEKIIGGREMTLYEIGGKGGGRRYGAAFSEDGVLYVLASSGGVSKEAFEVSLSQLEK